ncbi:MAG TPA: hypothetical protein VJ456_08215 [Acidimicrobiia bacterium]|nr:hypothetical protein [Acidimicrobiia bacterium]
MGDRQLGAPRRRAARRRPGPGGDHRRWAHGDLLLSKDIVARIAGGGLSLDDVLAAEAAAQGAASRTHDYGEGITAFQEKRKPSFTGR